MLSLSPSLSSTYTSTLNANIHLNTHTYTHIYQVNFSISFSLYKYCHPLTDCFVISQFFSGAKPARGFKPKSKPGGPVSRVSYPREIVTSVKVKEFFLHIRYRLMECLVHEKSYCISAYVAAGKSLKTTDCFMFLAFIVFTIPG